MRFTEMQTQLSEGMKDMVRIYYLLKENKESPIPALIDFLKRLTGKNFRYDGKLYFQTPTPPPDTVVFGSEFCNELELSGDEDSDKQICEEWKGHFIKNMDALHDYIIKGKPFGFRYNIMPHPHDIWKAGKTGKSRRYQMIHLERWSYPLEALEKHGCFENSTGHRRPFHTMPIYFERLGFFQLVAYLWDESMHGGAIGLHGFDTFLGITTSLLVHYHLAFGSFDRIKVCKQCKKIVFEKRRGTKIFCSKPCKMRYIRSSEGEKSLCRERQGSWLRPRLRNINSILKLCQKTPNGQNNKSTKTLEMNLDNVNKDDCRECNKCMESGKCTVLIDRNKEAFRILRTLSTTICLLNLLLNSCDEEASVVMKSFLHAKPIRESLLFFMI